MVTLGASAVTTTDGSGSGASLTQTPSRPSLGFYKNKKEHAPLFAGSVSQLSRHRTRAKHTPNTRAKRAHKHKALARDTNHTRTRHTQHASECDITKQ